MPVFLFTDIENASRLWGCHGVQMAEALSRYDALLGQCLSRYGGRIFKRTRSGVFAVFEAGEPLQCALEIQKQFGATEWGGNGVLRLRMALHAGEAETFGEDYYGPVVDRTAKLLRLGWGGQILLTPEAAKASQLPPPATLQDLGIHFLKDYGDLQQIYGLRHPDLAHQTFPALRSLTAWSQSLPPQPTPFLGREAELARIAAFLDDPSCRLLTLTGPGGIGKTRLAIQAAVEQVDVFPQGICFVPLAPLRVSESILYRLADSLKFSFSIAEDPKAQLLTYLQDKEMLMVWDNFEHLLDGAGLLKEILASAPKLKLLVTSRERLNLEEERVLEVQGMDFPKDNSEERLESFSAVQLFLQGASKVYPGFVVKKEDRSFVTRICQIVEGMPLGIELASTWIWALPCREIVREIERNRDFLATTLPEVPERHRSLRAVFESSWMLLSKEERKALTLLSVFRGGFRGQEAERVAGASLGLLSSLANKSLLRQTAGGRYEILEVLRRYAEEKLQEVNDE